MTVGGPVLASAPPVVRVGQRLGQGPRAVRQFGNCAAVIDVTMVGQAVDGGRGEPWVASRGVRREFRHRGDCACDVHGDRQARPLMSRLRSGTARKGPQRTPATAEQKAAPRRGMPLGGDQPVCDVADVDPVVATLRHNAHPTGPERHQRASRPGGPVIVRTDDGCRQGHDGIEPTCDLVQHGTFAGKLGDVVGRGVSRNRWRGLVHDLCGGKGLDGADMNQPPDTHLPARRCNSACTFVIDAPHPRGVPSGHRDVASEVIDGICPFECRSQLAPIRDVCLDTFNRQSRERGQVLRQRFQRHGPNRVPGREQHPDQIGAEVPGGTGDSDCALCHLPLPSVVTPLVTPRSGRGAGRRLAPSVRVGNALTYRRDLPGHTVELGRTCDEQPHRRQRDDIRSPRMPAQQGVLAEEGPGTESLHLDTVAQDGCQPLEDDREVAADGALDSQPLPCIDPRLAQRGVQQFQLTVIEVREERNAPHSCAVLVLPSHDGSLPSGGASPRTDGLARPPRLCHSCVALVISRGVSLDIRVLGPLEAVHESASIALPGGRIRELLLRLVVAGSHPLPVERLAADLWPESDDRTPTSTVRTYVARLRNALPEDVVSTRVGGYALDRSRLDVDADRFEEIVRAAQARVDRDPEAAAALLGDALSMWRGPALAEVADQAWARATASRLEDMRLAALELQAEAQLAAGGDPRELASRLAELTSAHPLRERLWHHRMLALYRCGRQADALACYQDLRQLLAEELGIEPRAELRDLERAILTQDPALDDPRATVPAEPPPPAVEEPAIRPAEVGITTSLVGRTREIARLRSLLDTVPVVTLIGPGGVGKSRLAREVVRGLDAPQVGMVEFAPVTASSSVEGALAAALGVTRRSGLTWIDVLRSALADADMLLLLDNCEHLTAEVGALLTQLLPTCPGVRVLATSREPLRVDGERIVTVDPLAVPTEDAPLEQILEADAVRLFAARAAAVSPEFVLDAASAPTVARICRRLDGLPFAIELAAARMRVLTPEDVEIRLDERFGLLTGGRVDARHETLREAVAWSYDLLTDDERRAFRHLSVFVGPFDIRGAAAVFSADRDDDAIDVVARLIDRSLLSPERRGDGIRYRMLETVRAFGLEQLQIDGELVEARNLHTRYLAGVAIRAGRMLHGPHEAKGHELLMGSRDDLRAAFDWAVVAGRWSDAARIVTAVPWERVGRSLQWDLSQWATRLAGESPPLEPALSARLHATATIGHWLAGAGQAAHDVANRALEIAGRCDEETYVETALAVAWMLWEAGDLEEAAALYLPLADPSLGKKVGPDVAAYCLGGMVMGITESGLGADSQDTSYVDSLSSAAVDLAQQSGSPAALAMAHLATAYSMLDRDPETARQELHRVVAIEGLALPTWALHARSHLARFRAHEGASDDLMEELADILATAVSTVDEIHLRLVAGFVGGALAVAGMQDAAPSLRPLALEAFALPTNDRWRRGVATILGVTSERAPVPPLSGLELEATIRDAIHDLSLATATAPSS